MAATERRNGSSGGSFEEGRVGASSGAKVRHAREDAAASSSDEQDKALLLRPRGHGAANEEQEQQLRPRGNGAADEEQEQQSSTSSEEEEQRVELFGSDPEQTWWHYKLSVELYLTAFFFAFSGGFTNVVYLIRYGVFSSVPMGNFIRLGVVISEAFADRLRDLKQDLGREEYAQAKVVAKFAGPDAFISVLVGAILANAFGGLLAHDWAMEASERSGGVFLAGLAILLEGSAWWHYQSVYRVLGGDHPSADKCFPLGVLLGAASGGAQNYFTGMGPMRVNTVGLTGVLQRVPPLIVDKHILDDEACFGALQCRCCTRAKKPAKLLQMSPTQRSSTRVSAASTVAEAEAERLRLPCYSSESRVFSYMYALVPLGMLCGVAVAGYLHTRPQFATSLWPPFITLVPLVLCYLVHDFVLLQPEKHTESGDLLSLEQVKAKCRMERRRAAHRERAARRGRIADGKHHGKKAHDDHENRSAVESAAADVVRDAGKKKSDTSEESGTGADKQNEKHAGSRYHAHHHTSSAATTSAGARRSRKSSSRIEPAGTGFKEPQLKLTLLGSTKEDKNTEQ